MVSFVMAVLLDTRCFVLERFFKKCRSSEMVDFETILVLSVKCVNCPAELHLQHQSRLQLIDDHDREMSERNHHHCSESLYNLTFLIVLYFHIHSFIQL